MRCKQIWIGVVAFLVIHGLRAENAEESRDQQTLRALQLETTDPALLDYLKKRSPGDPDSLLSRVGDLVKQLGDEDFAVREHACDELVSMGTIAQPSLRQALMSTDAEVRYRAKMCLDKMESKVPTTVAQATVRLLASRKPEGTVEVLLDFLPFAGDDTVTEEVISALGRLAVQNGKPAPAMIAALRSPSAAKRAVVAELLGKTGAKGEQGSLRKLLADSDPKVRLGAGLGLLWLQDREAIKPLIGLIEVLPASETWRIEAVLLSLAGDTAPKVPLGQTQTERKQCAEAWGVWWKQNGEKADLNVLAKRNRQGNLFAETFQLPVESLQGRYKQMRYETNVQGKGAVTEGRLRLDGEHGDGDQRLTIAASEILDRRTFPGKFRVLATLGGEDCFGGGYHVGISIGNIRVLFHPGLQGGAFRAERVDTQQKIIQNQTMPFTPTPKVLHEMIIDVDTTKDVATLDVLVIEGGKTGKQYRQTININPDMIGEVRRIGLERSGGRGGAAFFGSLIINR